MKEKGRGIGGEEEEGRGRGRGGEEERGGGGGSEKIDFFSPWLELRKSSSVPHPSSNHPVMADMAKKQTQKFGERGNGWSLRNMTHVCSFSCGFMAVFLGG